ncbi:MAG: hypothetical protein K1X79_02165 [Oligoflexia bacterium]|nr:hypothetical protein [Oligoflexia bacterium]
MENLTAARLIVSGTHRGVGASLLGIGLAAELRRRGLGVSCAVVGPNLGQALIYKRLVGRTARCFDDRLLAPGQTLITAYQSSVGADFILIDGSAGGLYDGYTASSQRGSAAELAANIHTPVVLVVDPKGFGASLAALVRGYRDFASDFEVSSVLLSRFSEGLDGTASREFFEAAFQAAALPAILGAVPPLTTVTALPEIYALQAESRSSLGRQFLIELGGLVQQHVDVESLIDRGRQALGIRITDYEHRPQGRRTRIAVADDSCFGLMFQDNLDWLRYYGAEVVPFSPLADDRLPQKVGAVYIGGCYLEEYGSALAQNSSMKNSISDFVAAGGVLYTEGAGSAYVARTFRTQAGDTYEGVGVIPSPATASRSPWAYADAVTVEESILGRAGLIVKGINTHEWKLGSEERMVRALRFSGSTSAGVHEGYSPEPQVVNTFSFLHFGSNPEIAKNIVDAAEVAHKL